mgnify:FL=1
MANATPSHLGIKNAASYSSPQADESTVNSASFAANNALFIRVFSGEVQARFQAQTVLRDKTRVRTIPSGRSAVFNAVGNTTAAYHVPGTEIVGSNVKQDERIIQIDDVLLASTFVSNFEEALNHYDVRSAFSREMGDALAQTYDRNLFATAGAEILSPSSAIADQGVAEAITLDASPTFAELVDQIYVAARKLDEKNVPENDRYVYVSPTVYYGLLGVDKVLNRDFVTGNGDFADGKIFRIAGMGIIKTNNMQADHSSTSVDFRSKYDADMSNMQALIMHPEALGTVQLGSFGMSTEAEYDIRRQGVLMVSKMAVGHGVLRPECILGIKTDGTNNTLS